MWSVQLMTSAPQMKSATPATVLPFTHQPQHDADPDRRRGERDQPADRGERREEHRSADTREPVAESDQHALHHRREYQPVDHGFDRLADGLEVVVHARPEQLLERPAICPARRTPPRYTKNRLSTDSSSLTTLRPMPPITWAIWSKEWSVIALQLAAECVRIQGGARRQILQLVSEPRDLQQQRRQLHSSRQQALRPRERRAPSRRAAPRPAMRAGRSPPVSRARSSAAPRRRSGRGTAAAPACSRAR